MNTVRIEPTSLATTSGIPPADVMCGQNWRGQSR
jgi:hypothetical protein